MRRGLRIFRNVLRVLILVPLTVFSVVLVAACVAIAWEHWGWTLTWRVPLFLIAAMAIGIFVTWLSGDLD